MGRDGTCRYPTDTCSADHRVDFEAGGPTSAGNLACQRDHNIMVPHTGGMV